MPLVLRDGQRGLRMVTGSLACVYNPPGAY